MKYLETRKNIWMGEKKKKETRRLLPYRTPELPHQARAHNDSLKNRCNKILSHPVYLNKREVFSKGTVRRYELEQKLLWLISDTICYLYTMSLNFTWYSSASPQDLNSLYALKILKSQWF